jgi:hypothetical protein
MTCVTRTFLVVGAVATLAACGGDDGTGDPDAGARADGGPAVIDAGSMAGTDGGAPATDAGGGGSTVGMLCANDDNCTGAGEVCCLVELPTACQLLVDCPEMTSGIPCTARDDCPNGGNVCCRVGEDQFCTRPSTCEGFGGDEIP